MSLATATELRNFLRHALPFTAAELASAELALELATGAVKDAAGQDIEPVEDDIFEVAGNWTDEVVLPQRPVTAVTEVQLNGLVLVADVDYVFDGVDTLRRGGLVLGRELPATGGYWGGPRARVRVVYSHGFEVIPSSVKGVCLVCAARVFTNPTGEIQEATGSYSATHARSVGVELSRTEKALLTTAGLTRKTRSLRTSPPMAS